MVTDVSNGFSLYAAIAIYIIVFAVILALFIKKMRSKENVKENKIVNIITIVSSSIFYIILPFSVLFALVSPMMFDAPGSDENPFLWAAFFSAITSPLIILISVITSILLFKRFSKAAFLVSLLPFINIVTIMFAWLYA